MEVVTGGKQPVLGASFLPATGLEVDEILEQTCGFMPWSLVDEPNK